MDTRHIIQYSRAIATIKDLPNFLYDNPKIYAYFLHQTKTNYHELIDLLKIAKKEPQLFPVLNLKDKYGRSCWGITKLSPRIILIRQNLLNGLEQAKLETTIYNTSFLLAVTILHELIHYLRIAKNLDDGQYESGNDFERWSFGATINLDNAKTLNKYQHSFNNLKWLIKRDKNITHDYKAK